MRIRSLLLTLLVASSALSAQKVVDALNESAPISYYSTANDYFVLKRPLTGPLVLTALEYKLLGTSAAVVEVGVWDENAVTGKPGTLLGSGSVPLTPNVPGWYGATFSTPIVIASSGNYFVGVKMQSGVKVGLAANSAGTSTPHWFNPNAGWSGPWPSFAWPFRLYGGSHAGAFTSYGTGKAGTGAFVPALRGLGWPNTGNPIQLQASAGLGGANVMFVFGTRTAITLTIGTVYAFPLVSIPALADGVGPGAGFVTLEVPVPPDPALHGVSVATQAWFLDPGAGDSVTHTGGVEMVLAH